MIAVESQQAQHRANTINPTLSDSAQAHARPDTIADATTAAGSDLSQAQGSILLRVMSFIGAASHIIK